MPATKLRLDTIGVVLVSVLLLCTAPVASFAQQSGEFELGVTSEVRALLTRAEAAIAGNRADAAYAMLSAAEVELAGNPYFDYLLGVSALDTGRVGEAVFSLRRALAVEPRYSGARMELARAYYESGNPELARPLFVTLLGEQPPAAVRDVIQQYIDAIDAKPATPRSRFNGYVETFAGYDSNANGSTSNQQFLGFTLNPANLETDSPFAEIGAGFNWIMPQSSRFAWLVNARAGHRSNSDASFINSSILNGFGGGTWQYGNFFGRAGVDAYWSARDGSSNEFYSGVDLLFGRRLAERWDMTLGLRGGAHRFDSTIEVLDVDRFLYTLGVAHRFSPTSVLTVQAIGGNDSEKQSGSPYGNSKFGGRVALSAQLASEIFLHASVGSLTADFDGLFFGLQREDTQTTTALQLEFRNVLTDGLTFMPMLRYVENESDVSLYDYDRTEIGLLIRWTPQ